MTPWEALSQICRAFLSSLTYSNAMEIFSHHNPIETEHFANEIPSFVVLKTSRLTIGRSSEAIKLLGHLTIVDGKFAPLSALWINCRPFAAKLSICCFNWLNFPESNDWTFKGFNFDCSSSKNFSSIALCTRMHRIWFKSSFWKHREMKSVAPSRSADCVIISVDLVLGSVT